MQSSTILNPYQQDIFKMMANTHVTEMTYCISKCKSYIGQPNQTEVGLLDKICLSMIVSI